MPKKSLKTIVILVLSLENKFNFKRIFGNDNPIHIEIGMGRRFYYTNSDFKPVCYTIAFWKNMTVF